MRHVREGVAELRIRGGGVVNTKLGAEDGDGEGEIGVGVGNKRVGVGVGVGVGVRGVKIIQPGVLSGPYLRIRKGSFGTVAEVRVEEGMWEEKRGRKVKGGERKRKIEEKREKVRKEKEEREKALGLS